ncbi:MAG: DUF3179 domain-containing protein [Acidobacteria bacterium]|nr:DUF3179 domain-containing protein [Acidobacteriota bacterium]
MRAPRRFLLLALALLPLLACQSQQQEPKPEPKQEQVGDGILMHILEPDAIPAIDDPQFVSAKEAKAFMHPDEPVLGLFDGKVAKAYSLWHLDRHEIVNDSLPGLGPVAVTW